MVKTSSTTISGHLPIDGSHAQPTRLIYLHLGSIAEAFAHVAGPIWSDTMQDSACELFASLPALLSNGRMKHIFPTRWNAISKYNCEAGQNTLDLRLTRQPNGRRDAGSINPPNRYQNPYHNVHLADLLGEIKTKESCDFAQLHQWMCYLSQHHPLNGCRLAGETSAETSSHSGVQARHRSSA